MEKKLIILYFVIAILLAGNVFQFVGNNTNPILSKALVPDEETALKIAEVVLISAYGDDVSLENPKVTFNILTQTWYVRGSLPAGYAGKDPEIYIKKSDGRILKINGM